jgi:hypothetical protein
MITTARGNASATLSGRELALQRRQAMANSGKAGVARVPAAARSAANARPSRSAGDNGGGPKCDCNAATSAATPAASYGASTAQRSNAAALSQPAQDAQPVAVARRTPQPAVESGGVRALARLRRAALTQDGKAGLTRVAQAARIATTMPDQDWQAAMTKGASGRQVSMQRRKALSLAGRSGQAAGTATRTSGRVKARGPDAAVPPGVVPGPAPVAKIVTGTMVERGGKVTGNEPGARRNITGTEHIGGEPFNFSSRSRPAPASAPAPAKVAVSHTGGGRPVTGTMVGRSGRQTGDEAGSCRPVTGTEYLSTEHFREICKTTPPETPRKVSVMSTRGDQTLSGTSVDRSGRVTGNEVGSCRSITGSQYYTTADFAGLCETPTPRKVGRMETVGGRTVTGSEVAPSPKLSGDETFGYKPVTGTDYIGTRQLATLGGNEGVAPVTKVVVDQSLGGQTVSGSYPGRAGNVTGNEAGACSLVSGDQYSGASQFQQFCPAPNVAQQRSLVRDSASIPATAVTGDRPGAGGSPVTGDERGSCGAVTGTPYLGIDNMPTDCTAAGRFGLRGQAPLPVAEAPTRGFSIKTPASEGRERRDAAVTGSALDNARITGPVNKGAGLITGTPDFRHVDNGSRQAKDDAALAAAQRVSGEGNQQGRRISGDAWYADSRVSGTEGTSSLSRNPSQRGQPRGVGSSAATFRNIERPEIPDSVVTGSAGSARRGAAITVSGGARG